MQHDFFAVIFLFLIGTSTSITFEISSLAILFLLIMHDDYSLLLPRRFFFRECTLKGASTFYGISAKVASLQHRGMTGMRQQGCHLPDLSLLSWQPPSRRRLYFQHMGLYTFAVLQNFNRLSRLKACYTKFSSEVWFRNYHHIVV
jgi:hypothetical protein